MSVQSNQFTMFRCFQILQNGAKLVRGAAGKTGGHEKGAGHQHNGRQVPFCGRQRARRGDLLLAGTGSAG